MNRSAPYLLLAAATLSLSACADSDERPEGPVPIDVDASLGDAALDAASGAPDASPDASPDAGALDAEPDAGEADPLSLPLTLGSGDRLAPLYGPADRAARELLPLIISLHGYSGTGAFQTGYFTLEDLAARRRVLVIAPDGRVDAGGQRFWASGAACCNFFGAPESDEEYLVELIDDAIARAGADPKRVYVVGHSNGGFMAHTMACRRSDKVAAIVSLAGSSFVDDAECAPERPVGVLQIHGTADTTIRYEGGRLPLVRARYPGALEVIERWASLNGCDAIATESSTPISLTTTGADSDVFTWPGCDAPARVELRRINGGTHLPRLADDFADQVLDFLLSSARS